MSLRCLSLMDGTQFGTKRAVSKFSRPKIPENLVSGPQKSGHTLVLDVLLEASIMEEAGRFEDLLRPLIRRLG